MNATKYKTTNEHHNKKTALHLLQHNNKSTQVLAVIVCEMKTRRVFTISDTVRAKREAYSPSSVTKPKRSSTRKEPVITTSKPKKIKKKMKEIERELLHISESLLNAK